MKRGVSTCHPTRRQWSGDGRCKACWERAKRAEEKARRLAGRRCDVCGSPVPLVRRADALACTVACQDIRSALRQTERRGRLDEEWINTRDRRLVDEAERLCRRRGYQEVGPRTGTALMGGRPYFARWETVDEHGRPIYRIRWRDPEDADLEAAA